MQSRWAAALPSCAAEGTRFLQNAGQCCERSAEDSDCCHSRPSAPWEGPVAAMADPLSVTAAQCWSVVRWLPGIHDHGATTPQQVEILFWSAGERCPA